MRKPLIIVLFCLIAAISSFGQEISIKVENQALNEVLIQIRDQYSIFVSFDDRELSHYKISVNQQFSTPEEAFSFLLKDLPFEFEKQGDVYLFYHKTPKAISPKSYRVTGKIRDDESFETLPFAYIRINGVDGITDKFGNFNLESKSDSIFHLKISYLGYQVLDTTVNQGYNHHIYLATALVNIKEVEVKGSPKVFYEQTGSKAGLMRINHRIAQLIPGNGDNSVFNLLRLQPGVLASGEQSNEMIIWGSSPGQSQVNFDDITLYGLKNYNDNISPINPNMAKDIRILKGGYDATMGERVGGIVDITGIEGNKKKPGINLNLNNMTMNILAETPIGERASLVGAFRQTYYDLYSPGDFSFTRNNNSHMDENSIAVNPNYVFRDGNLKFSGQTKVGDSYQVSTFWGHDHFSYSVGQNFWDSHISQDFEEKNRQYGARVNYNKIWSGKGSSELSTAFSKLNIETDDKQISEEMGMGHAMHNKDQSLQNSISNLTTKLSNKIRLSLHHELEFGSGLILNTTLLKEKSFSTNTINQQVRGAQIVSYLQDLYSLNKKINFTYGLRVDYATSLNKTFFQPRLSLALIPFEKWQFNFSWGLYNQFIMLSSIIDQNNNVSYQWRLSDDRQIPVLSAQHWVAGGIFRKNGFSFSVEGYYKETQGISRIIESNTLQSFYTGKSKTMGLDFFVKKEYKGHTAWISYTVGQSLEWFPYFQSSAYEKALHDQRHEIKLAGIINLSPFFISANYVYGSGFFQNKYIATYSGYNFPYKRADVAGIYRFSFKKMKLETGVSILNLFNHKNIKYTNVVQVPVNDNSTVSIYSDAIPFTPTVFVNISF